MEIVLLTALGVGGATVLGALLGFLFRKTSQKFNDAVLSFAAGVFFNASHTLRTLVMLLPETPSCSRPPRGPPP